MNPRPFAKVLLPLAFGLSCSQVAPSRQPLGLGPLALAEQSAVAQSNDAERLRKHADSRRDPDFADQEDPPAQTPTSSGSSVASATAGGATYRSSAPSTLPLEPSGKAAEPLLDEADWVGTYAGTDVTRYVMPGQTERNFDDPKAKIRIERRGSGRLALVFIDSSTGQDLCTLESVLESTRDGNVAKILPDQRCFIEPDDEMNVKSRPGTATRSGEKLEVRVILDTTLDLEDVHVEGRIEYEFDGSKR